MRCKGDEKIADAVSQIKKKKKKEREMFEMR